MTKVCVSEVIQAELRDPLGVEPTQDVLSAAAKEAVDLAHAAFDKRDPAAVDHAERLLYTVHAQHSFAPPLQGIASTIWPILMRAKLRGVFALVDAPKELDDDAMTRALNGAVQRADEQDHSFLDEIASAESLDGLVLYTRNWYGSTHGFTTQLFSLTQRCNGVARLYPVFKACLENVYEEFEKVAHPAMRARWPKRIGLDYSVEQSLSEPDQLTESFALQNFRTGVCSLNDPTYGLGSFFSIEAAFPGVCRRMYPNLKRRGFGDEDIATFKVHDATDEDHAAEFMTALRASELTPTDRAKVVRGALAQMEVRHQMFEAMRARLRRSQR